MQKTEAAERLLELVGDDLEVPLVDGGWVRYANFDNAASAPALRRVADAVAGCCPTTAASTAARGSPRS